MEELKNEQENEIQEANERFVNCDEMLKNQCENSQRELSAKDMKIQDLTRTVEQLKKYHQTKEVEFKKREEDAQTYMKAEKSKL